MAETAEPQAPPNAEGAPAEAPAPGGANTKAAVQQGIETYELTSAVIHNTLARPGENLSLTL